MQKVTSFNNVIIAFVKENDFRIYFWYMGKDEAIIIMKNSDLKKKMGHYKRGLKKLQCLVTLKLKNTNFIPTKSQF